MGNLTVRLACGRITAIRNLLCQSSQQRNRVADDSPPAPEMVAFYKWPLKMFLSRTAGGCGRTEVALNCKLPPCRSHLHGMGLEPRKPFEPDGLADRHAGNS